MPSSPSQDPNWLPWIAPLVAVAGLVWAFLRRFFVTVTRAELREALEDMRRERREMHQENLDKFEEIFGRMGDVENGLSQIRGELIGRRGR